MLKMLYIACDKIIIINIKTKDNNGVDRNNEK